MITPVPCKKANLRRNAIRRGLTIAGAALCVQLTAYAAGPDPSGMPETAGGGLREMCYLFYRTSPTHHPSRGGNDTIHSIQVSTAQSSKRHKIRLYPDARQQVLFFSASGQDGKVYQLFLFDMDGRLVSQTHIRNKETTVLTNISEGNFLFEVFTDDERIENGQLTVR
jgi:hypothetical protein